MSTAILPYGPWQEGDQQPRFVVNDNFLREAILQGNIISESTTAQPAYTSPTDDGKAYIIPAAATGAQWSTFSQYDLAIFYGGTWYAYAPVTGIRVMVAGVFKTWNGSAYVNAAGSTQGKQSIPIMAAGMRPSVSGGCAALATIASAANQPDIVTLDFDPSTIEYAQFAIPMPKKWNAGTITARFRWSHGATTTNFGVVWALQALAVSDDDAIAQNFGTAQTVTDTGGTTNDLYVTAETSAITIAGTPAKQDTIFVRVYRVATDGSDTLAVDARLHSVELFVTTDADTDA
jgi:hypothetical protein